MPARWKEVARLRFEGERFDTEDNALDLGAVVEIARFHKLVVKAAKSLWLRENPHRQRAPRRLGREIRMFVRTIEGEKSIVVRLEVQTKDTDMGTEGTTAVGRTEQAIELLYQVASSAQSKERNAPSLDSFPTALVREYLKWGKTLGDSEGIEFTPRNRQPIIVRPKTLDRLIRAVGEDAGVSDQEALIESPDIEDVLIGLAQEVPKQEWERLPADLTDNLDHYLYGTPKR